MVGVPPELPIEALRGQFLREIAERPVIITAPTGTGKSTGVPRWLFQARSASPKRPIVVVQPRRVAARAVAARVAELEGVELGKEVGYRVRDDDATSRETRLLVATPGILLADPVLLKDAEVVVLDELHERRLDTDLLFALLAQTGRPFVAMSATMDGQKVADAALGVHLHVEVRTYPVDIEYYDASPELPSARELEKRVRSALSRLPSVEGDVLVFLPGKGEIERVAAALGTSEGELVPLHGGLDLRSQARALSPSKKRRIILSTNVAETSLTIPGVRAVIDSGLVRRTNYHDGRSYLSLAHVALDSADQRAGRAGRTAPGHCLRLWGTQARLTPATPPEIHREELGPLVFTCALLGVDPGSLPFLDAPKGYALSEAQSRLVELGVVELPGVKSQTEKGIPRLTEVGSQLYGLPLDPWLSRVLIEAKKTGCLEDAIALVALLEQPQASALSRAAPDEQLAQHTCDAEALVYTLREAEAETGALRQALREARSTAARLRRAFGLTGAAPRGAITDRKLLLQTILKADPGCASVARPRKRGITFSNGGTEMEVARDSRVNRLLTSLNPADQVDALVVLQTHGVAAGADHKLFITLASPVPLALLAEAGLGTVSVKEARVSKAAPLKGKLVVTLERTYAGRLLRTTEEEPTGQNARIAIVELFVKGALHQAMKKEAVRRLARRSLAHALGQHPDFPHFKSCAEAPSLAEWLLLHLQTLGVESGDDLALLSPSDFLPPDVPAELSGTLDERFPLEVDVGDCLYRVEYDLKKRQATLSIARGARQKPPPPNYLPRFEGLRVFVEAGGSFHPMRR